MLISECVRARVCVCANKRQQQLCAHNMIPWKSHRWTALMYRKFYREIDNSTVNQAGQQLKKKKTGQTSKKIINKKEKHRQQQTPLSSVKRFTSTERTVGIGEKKTTHWAEMQTKIVIGKRECRQTPKTIGYLSRKDFLWLIIYLKIFKLLFLRTK